MATMIWTTNMLLLLVVAGWFLSRQISQNGLQFQVIVQNVVYAEPGEPRVRVFGVQIKSGAFA